MVLRLLGLRGLRNHYQGHVNKGIMKDLTIPSLALFIARRDLVLEKYGRPEENNEYYELKTKIMELQFVLEDMKNMREKS